MKTGKLKRLCAIVSSASVLLGSAVLYSVASAESITPGTYDRDDVPDQAYVNNLQLEQKEESIWGSGIITGTGPFDEHTNEGDVYCGDDASAANDVIRSYDTITYNVEVNVQSKDGVSTYQSGRVGYQFMLPDDPELELDLDAMGWVQDLHEDTATVDGTDVRIYTVYRNLPTENGHAIPGGCTVPFIVKVGGKRQGDIVAPTVKAWAEGDAKAPDYAERYAMKIAPVKVTAAPKYNVELVNWSNTLGSHNAFEFADAAYNTQAGRVTGFEAIYGFALQLRNDNADKGIRGVEIPKPGEEISFDVDLTTTFRDQDVTAEYTPLLWSVEKNGEHNQVLKTPMTGNPVKPGEEEISCKNSGDVTAVQTGNKIHFTLKNFEIDMNAFPKRDRTGSVHYYTTDGKILVGNFSAYKFTVVQPISYTDGENIKHDLRKTHGEDGLVQLDAQDTNLHVVSLSDKTVSEQTKTDDDSTTQTRSLVTGGRRTQEIFYSYPGNVNSGTDNVSNGNKANGSDTALCGAQVGATQAYSEADIGTEDISEHTIAADQLVKFDDRGLEVDAAIRRQTGRHRLEP